MLHRVGFLSLLASQLFYYYTTDRHTDGQSFTDFLASMHSTVLDQLRDTLASAEFSHITRAETNKLTTLMTTTTATTTL